MHRTIASLLIACLLSSAALGQATQRAAAPATQPDLTGRVVDAAGAPVAEAEVVGLRLEVGPGEMSFEQSILAKVTTGADGAFAVPQGPPGPMSIVMLAAHKEGKALGWWMKNWIGSVYSFALPSGSTTRSTGVASVSRQTVVLR